MCAGGAFSAFACHGRHAMRAPAQAVCRQPAQLNAPLVSVHIDRHSSQQAKLTFGCLNIRSLANKLEDLLEVRRDQLLDVMLLVETWHDSDSVSLGRLRADGFQVVDRPRPRSRGDTFATNHGA